MSFAQIQVIGNVGRDPDIRHQGDGSVVANFSIAVNKKFTDRQGVLQKQTAWYQVNVWQTAERSGLVDVVSKYVIAGTQLMVQGEPVQRKFTDKDGLERNVFEIRLSGPNAQLRLLGGTRPQEPRPDAGEPAPPPAEPSEPDVGQPAAPPPPPPASRANGTSRGRKPAMNHLDPNDDVPF